MRFFRRLVFTSSGSLAAVSECECRALSVTRTFLCNVRDNCDQAGYPGPVARSDPSRDIYTGITPAPLGTLCKDKQVLEISVAARPDPGPDQHRVRMTHAARPGYGVTVNG